MATLYFFVGLPGSGKTTAANIICAASGGLHIWADRERQAKFDRPTHSLDESAELYEQLNLKSEQTLREGRSVVFDTNFNYRKDRDHMRAIAERASADVRIIRLTTDRDFAKERATHENHADKNGMHHVMSDETFERIASHYEPLGEDEPSVDINGTNLDESELLRKLQLI